jgi:hypothetical protein
MVSPELCPLPPELIMALPELLSKLTYRFQGRDFCLTDVHGQVVKGSWPDPAGWR